MRLRSNASLTLWLVALALAPLQGCRDAGPTGPCESQVEITVTAGLAPAFRWTPSCSIGYLTVELVETDGSRSPTWTTGDPLTSIRPGIQYGSRNENPATPLLAGSTYRVRVGTQMCSGFDCVVTVLGTHDFTR